LGRGGGYVRAFFSSASNLQPPSPLPQVRNLVLLSLRPVAVAEGAEDGGGGGDGGGAEEAEDRQALAAGWGQTHFRESWH
jgi:hypothetical protein